MAHGLKKSDSLMSMHSVPWHGLGVVLKKRPESIEEALKLSGLDWEVIQRPAKVSKPVLGSKTKNELVTLDNWNVNLRSDTLEPLGIVTDRYVPVQNIEAFSFLANIFQSEMHFETAGSLHGGKRVWVMLRLPENIEVAGDLVAPYAFIQNSHDGKTSVTTALTPVRIVCHAAGTPIIDGDWRGIVEDHPSASGSFKSSGKKIEVRGLPFSEKVSDEHAYWVREKSKTLTPKRKVQFEEETGGTAVITHHVGVDKKPGWVMAQDLQPAIHEIGSPIDDVEAEAPPIPIANVLQKGWERDGRSGSYEKTVWSEGRDSRLDDPEWLWLLGYWIGDGNLHRGRGRKSAGLTFSVAFTQPEIKDRIEKLLESCGWSGKATSREGCWQITFCDQTLGHLVDTWDGKTPPEWIEKLPLDLQRKFVKGWYAADGNVDTTEGCILASVNLDGLLSLRRILARLGIPSSIRNGNKNPSEYIQGRKVKVKKAYTIRFWRNAEQLGFKTRFKGEFSHPYIEDGHLWSRVERTESIEDDFVPITTETRDYLTAFGRSHNCNNTLTAAMNRAKGRDAKRTYSIRHLGNMEAKIEEARSVLDVTVNYYDDLKAVGDALGSAKASDKQAKAYVERLFSTEGLGDDAKGNREEIQRSVIQLFKGEGSKGNTQGNSGQSFWTLYNAAIEHLDWEREERVAGSKFSKTIYDPDGLKAKAWEVVLDQTGLKIGTKNKSIVKVPAKAVA